LPQRAGVAREVAALTASALRPPLFPTVTPTTDELAVRIEAPELCGRFSGRVVRGLNARAETPRGCACAWSAAAAIGVRSGGYFQPTLMPSGPADPRIDLGALRGGLVVEGAPRRGLRFCTAARVELDRRSA